MPSSGPAQLQALAARLSSPSSPSRRVFEQRFRHAAASQLRVRLQDVRVEAAALQLQREVGGGRRLLSGPLLQNASLRVDFSVACADGEAAAACRASGLRRALSDLGLRERAVAWRASARQQAMALLAAADAANATLAGSGGGERERRAALFLAAASMAADAPRQSAVQLAWLTRRPPQECTAACPWHKVGDGVCDCGCVFDAAAAAPWCALDDAAAGDCSAAQAAACNRTACGFAFPHACAAEEACVRFGHAWAGLQCDGGSGRGC